MLITVRYKQNPNVERWHPECRFEIDYNGKMTLDELMNRYLRLYQAPLMEFMRGRKVILSRTRQEMLA